MSESGKVISTHANIIDAKNFSVSNDNIIYLADFSAGVHQSTDAGFTWNLILQSTTEKSVLFALKVAADKYWIVSARDSENDKI